MNSPKANTEAAPAAMPFDYETAFSCLEHPISDALNRAKVVEQLVFKIDAKPEIDGCRRLLEGELDALAFMVVETAEAIKRLDGLWLGHHNASVCVEREMNMARRAS